MHEHTLHSFATRFRLHAVGVALLPILAGGARAQTAPAPALDVAPMTTQPIAAPASADRPTEIAVPTTDAPLAGPMLVRAMAGARVTHPASREMATRNVVADNRAHAGRAAALMITGGAAVVLGLLVGGDAEAPLIVGGAVIGLLGLYDFVR